MNNLSDFICVIWLTESFHIVETEIGWFMPFMNVKSRLCDFSTCYYRRRLYTSQFGNIYDCEAMKESLEENEIIKSGRS